MRFARGSLSPATYDLPAWRYAIRIQCLCRHRKQERCLSGWFSRAGRATLVPLQRHSSSERRVTAHCRPQDGTPIYRYWSAGHARYLLRVLMYGQYDILQADDTPAVASHVLVCCAPAVHSNRSSFHQYRCSLISSALARCIQA